MTPSPPRRLAVMLLLGAGLAEPAVGKPTVDVWLELADNPLPIHAASASATAARSARVRAQQDDIAARLPALGASELARVQQVGNRIAVRIDADQIGKLQALPGVKRVRPVQTLHPPKPMSRPRDDSIDR